MSEPLSRRTVCVASLLGVILVGCGLHTSYVQTGPMVPALADGVPVRVFLTAAPDSSYTEIGVVEVKGGDLAGRVTEAQREARQRGGNAVVLVSSHTTHGSQTSNKTVETRDKDGKVISKTDVPVTETTSSDVQTFAVIRLD